MAITTLERADSREQSWAAGGSSALMAPVWVEQVRPVRRLAPADAPLGVVIPLRRASEVIPERRVRLTRRGRLTLTLTTAGCILAITGLAWSSSSATTAPPVPAPAASVVVAPGDTLWDLALRADPHADPRATVARIVELNDLAGGHIRPGQELQVPAG